MKAGANALPGCYPERIITLGKITFRAACQRHKYRKLGYGFSGNEIISSRDLLIHALQSYPSGILWGVAAPPVSEIGELASNAISLAGTREAFDKAKGFIFLSTQGRSPELQAQLIRPLFFGKPFNNAFKEAQNIAQARASARNLQGRSRYKTEPAPARRQSAPP
jgi:hypothetical protein